MGAVAKIFSGGFDEPVFGSQETFRAVMQAMAMPGTIGHVLHLADAPAPLNAASAALLLTMCDYDTPIHLSETMAQDDICGWISFHTGAPVAGALRDTRFAFFADAAEMPALKAFALGTDEYPDRSATAVLQVTALDGGGALELTGPGVKDKEVIAPEGLQEGFAAAWAANGALYPRGIDLILTCGAKLVCLPRTVKIREL